MSDTERKHMPEPGTAHRLKVFTGAGRRRTWPAEVKARIVAESYVPGTMACAVARRHGLSPQQLFA
jgi:transposase